MPHAVHTLLRFHFPAILFSDDFLWDPICSYSFNRNKACVLNTDCLVITQSSDYYCVYILVQDDFIGNSNGVK